MSEQTTSRFSVSMIDFAQLTEEEQLGASNNGSGKEYASYIRVTHDGETIYLESDACEPEDKTFGRDLGWIVNAIARAYSLGLSDGKDAA